MKKFAAIVFLVVNFLFSTTRAQNLQLTKTLHQGWAFIENKGQLADENGKLLPDIKFYGKDKGLNIYCRQESLSFVFTKTTFKDHSDRSDRVRRSEAKEDEPEIEKVDFERMDMKFMGCNANAQIITSDEKKDYLNFYLAHTPKEGITDVHQFEKLTYKNIYNKIDLVLYVKERGMKYEFVINRGGKVSDIKIKWEGTNPEMIQDGGIKYTNDLASMNESSPISFLPSGEKVQCNFKKSADGSISFEIGGYNENKTVEIDPTLSWATYYGGSGTDDPRGILADSSGNIYITGTTNSSSGISTSGTYQASLAGNFDVFIAKFNSSGSILWATYYGGTAADYVYGITIDASGNITISGITYSSSGIATSGAYQSNFAGNQDAFIAKFNSSGNIQWATYYGGSDIDEAMGIVADSSGNIYISGYTYSTSGIATSGAYQTSLSGSVDAFIAKFNSSGSIQWATYFGGNSVDYSFGISTIGSSNVFITGHTTSTSGITTSGAYQTANAGGFDAFIAKFNSSGSIQWATYYGTGSDDRSFGIVTNGSGNIYILGSTNSTFGIATSGAYQTSSGGGSDAFIAKFNSSGSIQWATYYGGSSLDQGFGITTSNSGNVYITGSTTSTSGIATSGAYQTSNAGNSDAFIAKFDSSGSIKWASYYGGSGNDLGRAIVIDGAVKIYLTGNTGSTSGIATSGAYQTSLGGGGDGYIAKFSDCISTDSTITKSVCDSFVLNNISYKTSGTYKQHFTNVAGCDSTVTLNLTTNKTTSTITQTGCDSLVINAITYKTGGTFTQKLTNAAGCDSTIMLNLTIKKSSTSFIAQTGCDSLVINSITYRNSGAYAQKITNTIGCDSTITLNLTIKKSSASTIYQNACDSTVINSVTYKTSGTYSQKKTNVAGCDSIITLNLTIKKSSSSTITQTACDSLVINSTAYYVSGTYVQKKINAVGCDSTITLNLTIKKSSTSTITQSTCDSFVLNNITYKNTGTYIQKKINAAGCDSTISLNLTIKKSSSSTISQTACDSLVFNNITYKTSGTYVQKRVNAASCDSTINLNLTINKAPDAQFTATVNNFNVTFIPAELNAKSYLWRFGNGDTSIQKIPVYSYPTHGNYTVKLKIISLQDCENSHDSMIVIQSNGIATSNITNRIILYPNPAKNEVRILGLSGNSKIILLDASGRVINVLNNITTLNTSNLSKGIYLVNISNEEMNVTKRLIIE